MNYKLSLVSLCLLFAFVACTPGTRTEGTYYVDKNYLFEKDKTRILVSLLNKDTWEAKDNQILENEIEQTIKQSLKDSGYSVFSENEILSQRDGTVAERLARYIVQNGIFYHMVLTIEPTETVRGHTPVTSRTTVQKVTTLDIFSGGLKQTPVAKTKVSGGESYSYNLVVITCSVYDAMTKKQVWFGRTRTRGSITDKIMDLYIEPSKTLVNQFLADSTPK